MLAFVVPGACWLKVNQLEGTPLKMKDALVHWVLIVFGFLLMFFTISFTIYKAVAGTDGGAKSCHW